MEFTAELPEQIHKILHMIFTAYKVYLHRNFLNLLKKLVNHTKTKKNTMAEHTKTKLSQIYRE